MKIKEGYVMKTVAGSNVVIATGASRVDFQGIITFNDTGADVFKMLDGTNTVEEIVNAMVKKYEISYEVAKEDIVELIEKMKAQGLIED